MSTFRFVNIPTGTPFTLTLQLLKRDNGGYLVNLEIDIPGLEETQFEVEYVGTINPNELESVLAELTRSMNLEIKSTWEYSTQTFNELIKNHPDLNNQTSNVFNMSNRAEF